MRALVTGTAGFIGSHLAEALIARGDDVVGVDSLTPYYDPAAKRRNLERLARAHRFEMVEDDLASVDLDALLTGVDVVFHLAAQPGVRLSWAEGFSQYVTQNVLATQRLLEAARQSRLQRLVYASSSSVYGNATHYPTSEAVLPSPHSPYGVTKLAAEHLCGLYAANYRVPTTSLRFFTVYGPRQRPDMAMHRLIEAALNRAPFGVFGTGEQVRDFTYVEDVVNAVIAAGTVDTPPGTVLNVSGGTATTMNEVIAIVSDILCEPIEVRRQPEQAGDVQRTGGSSDAVTVALGWRPEVDLVTGLTSQVRWHVGRRSTDLDVEEVTSSAPAAMVEAEAITAP